MILDGWEIASAPAGSEAPPASWIPIAGPTTAAGALRAAGLWSLDGPARRFDAEDWWFRARFAGEGESVLCLDGIATLATVSLNGTKLLETSNMFRSHRVPVTLAKDNELLIHCRSLDAALAAKKPRPRWKTPMLDHQQLRWHRTTLLGRTPGWSPPCAPVGPWRPVRIEAKDAVGVEAPILRARVDGKRGVLDVSARLRGAEGGALVLVKDGHGHRAPLAKDGDRAKATLAIDDVALWWPHTHGEPALYEASLVLGGATVPLGRVGFRTIAADTKDGGFAVSVNGAPVFCRGACWTPLDPVTLGARPEAFETAIAQAHAAGMNMLRVGGTMVYEDDAFYDACDRHGVLVWQDLMFANMDYPEDEAFVADATSEVREQLARLSGRASVAVICGNSEGEQQAAMFGASRDRFAPKLFHETFANLSQELLPDVPYWPSSAHGGEAFPHQPNRGTTSYYGVGAYLRELEDARRSEVRFASECLAFANPPRKTELKVHDPRWKARVPRDLGAGWDFDDVRDHYLARLFHVDPAALRYAEHDRYLALGAVAAGEAMAQTFGEWRRQRSVCAGGLVWFLRDLWEGAGWGVVAADGTPKAAWHFLRRALASTAVHISDEGLNGPYVHVFHDGPQLLSSELEIALFRGETSIGKQSVPVAGPTELAIVAVFDGFMDLLHAYRFGPPACDLIVATLGEHQAFHFPLGLPSSRSDIGLGATLDGDALRLSTRALAQNITIDAPGFLPDDDYFHLAPGATRTIRLRRTGAPLGKRILVTALNANDEIALPL